MTRGKVVLVPFPFDDLETHKARPAICLTEPLTRHRHIVLAFVTSRQPDELLDTDVVLDPQDAEFAQTGLQARSTIRTHRLLTVASSVIKREIGVLSPIMESRVGDAIARLFRISIAKE
ncbi:MAG: PemK-like protein [Acidobacteria bacterium RIFCSPLOWO2_02_FULL_68_18]|nr:MAG: PemK-like protein [Acidobacteria bacterium RIFCSPLOWO2_02_FULL_68_18]OFW51711.1 MAG: PemK-like protein [Acidobacteria bacterium RIFCSPLOWO2_12_FULL_68_19]